MHKMFFTHGRQTSVRVIFTGLFIGSLAISTTQVLAQTRPIKSPTESEKTQPVNPTVEKLVGTWEAKNLKDPSPSRSLKFIFTPTGKLFIVMSSGASETPLVYETRYEINSQPKPMHLDVTLPENRKVQTIFEFTDNDKLRVELYNSNPGKSRPKTFPEKTPLFEKISSSTTLPLDAKVFDPGSPNSPANATPEEKPTTSEPQNSSDSSEPKK